MVILKVYRSHIVPVDVQIVHVASYNFLALGLRSTSTLNCLVAIFTGINYKINPLITYHMHIDLNLQAPHVSIYVCCLCSWEMHLKVGIKVLYTIFHFSITPPNIRKCYIIII